MPAAMCAGSSHIWLKTGYVEITATVARHTTRAVTHATALETSLNGAVPPPTG